MAQFQFNVAEAPEAQAPRTFGPLPEGAYEMVITRSDIKATKAGSGHYIELEMQVTSGEHSGRRIWERLNIDNPNKTAEDIAKQALASLISALGLSDMQDTEQLHDKPFQAFVEIDRKEPTRNRIVGYGSTGPAKPFPAAKPAAPAAPAAPAKPAAKPWQR